MLSSVSKRILALFPLCASPAIARDEGARLDQVQFVGTHNSYHQAPDSGILDALRQSVIDDGPTWPGPRLARAIDYSRPPLTTQLDRGIRMLELDVHDDPLGTRFVQLPVERTLADRGGRLDRPWDPGGEMRRPGFKTLHKLAYDPRSSCPLFADCLAEIARWSRAHPDHDLIALMIEVKPMRGAGCPGLCDDGWARLDDALRTGLGSERIVAPLPQDAAWPAMTALRGKVMIILLDSEETTLGYRRYAEKANAEFLFTALRPGKGRPLLRDGHSRIAILTDPRDRRIAQAQAAGMLVYTRADADTGEARTGAIGRRDSAFASGATFIATDFPEPDPRFTRYVVRFPEGGYLRARPRARR